MNVEDDIKEQSKRCHFNNSILGGETSKQGICFLKQQDIKHGGGVLKEKKQTKVNDCPNLVTLLLLWSYIANKRNQTNCHYMYSMYQMTRSK